MQDTQEEYLMLNNKILRVNKTLCDTRLQTYKELITF